MRHCQPNHKATMPTSHVIFTTYSFGPGHNQKGLSLFGVGEWVGGVVVLVG